MVSSDSKLSIFWDKILHSSSSSMLWEDTVDELISYSGTSSVTKGAVLGTIERGK